jgi:hypothetical protein
MRVTPGHLLRIAKETAEKQAFSEPDLVAAYLTGSLRAGDPLIGGAGDIDIVFVHAGIAPVRREIIPLSAEIHLDILHHPRSDYERPKMLRVHPWLGPELYDPLLLHDSQHFFEFVQAGVRDKYAEPENVLVRSRTLADAARQRWSGLQLAEPDGPNWLLDYLGCLFTAANAVGLLSEGHVSERRLLLEFPARAETAGLGGMAPDLFHLCGGGRVDAAALEGLLADWENAFMAAATKPEADRRIVTYRLRYYKQAFEGMLADGNPQAILWPLLQTWTLAVSILPDMWTERWESACGLLGLDKSALVEKVDGLDHLLDTLEQALEDRTAGQISL